MRVLKKIGAFMMSILPMAVSIGLQFLILFGFMILSAIMTLLGTTGEGDIYMGVMQELQNNIMDISIRSTFTYHVVGTMLFIFWYYMACVRRKGEKRGIKYLLPTKYLDGKAIGVGVMAGISVCIMANAMVLAAQYFVPDLIREFERLMEAAGVGESGFMLVAAVMLAPIGEEFLCRGLILHYAKKVSRRFWIANIIQALMFGVMHMNLVQGTYAFFMGLVMGYLCERYQTLWIPILIHFISNLFSSIGVGIIFYFIPDNAVAALIVLFVSVCMCIAVIKIAGKREDENTADNMQNDISTNYNPYQ